MRLRSFPVGCLIAAMCSSLGRRSPRPLVISAVPTIHAPRGACTRTAGGSLASLAQLGAVAVGITISA
jgi:hypothetical protein